MRILPDPVAFVWDIGNIDKSFKKHGITNKETEEIFENKPAYIFEDQKHSVKEKRYGIFGQTDKGKLLTVVFTIRNDKVRIITSRSMSKRERRSYEKIKENTQL